MHFGPFLKQHNVVFLLENESFLGFVVIKQGETESALCAYRRHYTPVWTGIETA